MSAIIINSTTPGVLPPPRNLDSDWEEYVLQVSLVHQPNRHVTLGSFVLWQTAGGKALHGDQLIRWCPSHGCMGAVVAGGYELTSDENERIRKLEQVYQEVEPGSSVDPSLWPTDIQQKINGYWGAKAKCPSCQLEFAREDYASDYMFRASEKKVAEKMAEIWRILLHSSASVFMVKHKQNLGYQKALHALKAPDFNRTRYEKLLAAAKEKDDLVIFRMGAIHRQLMAGASLDKIFKGFLRS